MACLAITPANADRGMQNLTPRVEEVQTVMTTMKRCLHGEDVVFVFV